MTDEPGPVMEHAQAEAIAREWVEHWNAHRPDLVVAHFADDVVVRSPLAARIVPGSGGVVRGKAAVLDYYRAGLAAASDLHFTLVDTLAGVAQVTILYRNQRGMLAAEALRFGDDGLVTAVTVAHAAG